MEETDNKKSYKYNGYPLDYNRVINTMTANWRSYAQHMHWTSDQEKLARTELNNLLQAAENGMYSDYAGDLIGGTDAEGNVAEIQMSNPSWKDKKNQTVTAEEKKDLSARKQSKLTPSFDPTAEAVKYWQTIIQFVADKTREESKQKEADKKAEEEKANTPVPFTMADNGFWPTFIDTVSPNGIADFDLDWWWGLDPYDKTTGTRAVTGRTAELSNVLNDYIKNLESTNYDFSKEKVTKDEYLANLKKLQAALADKSLDLTDRGLLQRVGGTPADYKKLFMTDETWTETTSEEEEEEAEYDPEIVAALQQAKAAYEASKPQRNTGGASARQRITIPSLAGDTASAQLNSWLTRLATDNAYKAPDNIYEIFAGGDFSDQEGGGLEKYMGQYLTLLEKYGNETGTSLVRNVSYGPYSGYKYIVNSLNKDDMTVLAYNPSTGHTTRIFYPELGSEELESVLNAKVVTKNFAAMLEKIFGTSSSSETPKKQAGGTIDFDAARDAMEALASSRAESLAKSQADPKQRRPWAAADITNNNEWSTADIARIGSIVADIAAIVSPESYTSLGFSLAGDIGNFIADRSEGYTMLQSLGHLGVGLAGSAVSLIPIVGGVLGKTGRVTKGLVKLAPKLAKWMSYVGAAGLLTNSPEILKSLGKLTSTDPNEKMTMGDWRNILLGLEAILATKQGFKARRVANARINQAKTGETMVKVKMVGKPEEKGLIGIGGDDAKRLMIASENNDVEGINRILKGYNNGKWELDTHLETMKKPKEHFYEGIFTKRKTTDAQVMEPGSVYENLNPAQISTKNSKLPPYMRDNKIMPDNPTITAKKTPIKTPKAKPTAEAETKPAKASITKQNELISKAKEAYGKLPEGMTAAKAKALDVKKYPHSPEFNELAKTYDETSLIENGYWKRGGKISRARKVAKANGGESLSFSSGSLGSRTSENTGKGLGRKIVKAQAGTKIYGLGTVDYVPYLSYKTQYADGQATEEAVAATLAHNNALRQDENINNFTSRHRLGEDEGYKTWEEAAASINSDYYKGEQGTSNLLGDILWAAQNYIKSNPNASREEVLEHALNAPVKFMYDYRYNHPEDTDWYETNDKVAEFNKNHYNRYHGLNTKDWLGYTDSLENTYGSTSSIRPVYIAEKAMPLDFSKIDWSKYGEQGEQLKKIFDTNEGTYTQETSGIVSFTPETAPEVVSNSENTENTENSEADIIDFNDYFNNNPNTSSTGHDIVNKPYRGDFSMLGPDMLSLTRYLGSIPTNWQMYKDAKKMPVTLYNPVEAHRWVYGDQNAIQQGYRAAGIANHMAANPLTSDGALQTAAQFSAFDQGQDYIRNGYTTNDNMVRQTREANWTQDRTNQQSRYGVHNKNLDNLALHRTSVLTADATRRNTNYNSWSNFLSGLEQNWRSTAEKRQQQASAYAKLSKQNELLKMHIDSLKNDEDRQAINEVVMGTAEYSELSDTQKKLYLEIMHRVQEGLTKWEAGNIGVGYQPYLPGPYAGTSGTTSPWAPWLASSSIPVSSGRIYKRGGVIGGDTEKVAIQKLRTRVQKMQIFQKHLDSRMTACEKALDRAQRSASQYWRGMTKGK